MKTLNFWRNKVLIISNTISADDFEYFSNTRQIYSD